MSWISRTLSDLRQQARSAFVARLGASSTLRFSDVGVSADVMAGLTYEQFGFLQWLSTQILPDRAEGDWLLRWAALYGKTLKSASRAGGSVSISGAPLSPVLAGVQMQGGGQVYTVTAAMSLDATGRGAVSVSALLPGASGNAAPGQVLTFVSPPPGVAVSGVVGPGGLVGGADQEDPEDLRQRLLQRIQFAPAAGAASDYADQALSVSGVTRCWVVGNAPNFGDVTIYFMMDVVRSSAQGIPQGSNGPQFAGDQQMVLSAIASQRPVTAKLWPTAPSPKQINITVSNLTPNNPVVQAAVITELRDLFVRATSPGGTVYVSTIWQAVATAAGEQHHLITQPSADVACATGEIAVLGAVTFT